MDVALIQWPSDQGLREKLAEARHPRLLLVEADAEPPECLDVLEDWVRLPVSRADRHARMRALGSRAQHRDPIVPDLSGGGLLTYRGKSIQLSEMQAHLMNALLARFGAVVTRDSLTSVAWPAGAPTENNLDVTIGRLRRQIEPVGLRIRTVRSRGYLLSDLAI